MPPPKRLPLVVYVIIIVGVLYMASCAIYVLVPAQIRFGGLALNTALFVVFLMAGVFGVRRYETSLVGQLTQEGEDLAILLSFPTADQEKPGGEVKFFVPSCTTSFSPRDHLSYNVRALAMDDVRAVVELAQMLARSNIALGAGAMRPVNLFIEATEVRTFDGTLFHVGGPLPNVHVEHMIRRSELIDYQDNMDQDGTIAIVARQPERREFVMRPPWHDRTIEETEAEPTYGCVMRDSRAGRPRFAVWGLDARGTIGAARWFVRRWRNLPAYGIPLGEDFTAIVRVLPHEEGAEEPIKPSKHHRLLVPA